MNDKIKQLLEQCEDYGSWDNKVYTFDKEKFAELIVRECIEQGNSLANHYINTHPEQEQVMLLASIADYSNEIKQHFGVE